MKYSYIEDCYKLTTHKNVNMFLIYIANDQCLAMKQSINSGVFYITAYDQHFVRNLILVVGINKIYERNLKLIKKIFNWEF